MTTPTEAPRCFRHIGQPWDSAAVLQCTACLEALERVVTADVAKVLRAEIAPAILDDLLLTLAQLHKRRR
ncbi:MAG: hypothetical protein HKN10_02560 [Myxococcales bacterium]|nr:hypothetical protein [Myxococcales bacterium]